MPAPVSPEGYLENTVNALGEQAGALLPATFIPGASLGGLVKTGVGAGIGSGLARTVAPESTALDTAAQIIGGMGTGLAKVGAKAIPEKFERSMMERVVKPSTTLKESERIRRIDTARDEGITATKAGLEKSRGIINEINKEIQQRIDDFNVQGATVNRDRVVGKAYNEMSSKLAKEAFPDDGIKDVGKTLGEFKQHPENIPIRKAQDYKQSINRELDDFYKSLQYSPDKTAALAKQWSNKTKAKIADGLRAEISEIFPEVSQLNKREAALIQLNKTLERAVHRISQHDVWSLKGVVSMVAHPKYAVVNYVLNNPSVQSRLAVALRRARTMPVNVIGGAAETAKQFSGRE
jgi:hypothetical protein